MGLESFGGIWELNAANPTSADPVAQGDDHLRGVKAALKATFPNLTGPVTATQQQLNVSVPIGAILMWSGTHASVPAGWKVCDGQVYARTDGAGNIATPDLRGRFIYCSDSPVLHPPGETGGGYAASVSVATGLTVGPVLTNENGHHTHGASTGAVALTDAQIPPHYHAAAGNPGGAGDLMANAWTPGSSNNYILQGGGGSDAGGLLTTNVVGGGQPHAHSINGDGVHAHTVPAMAVPPHSHAVTTPPPPYYSLVYIMKV